MNKKTIKRNEIIELSIKLMYLRGYNGTSVKDITDAAGIPKGSFYNYFNDKEEYALYAMKYYDTEMSTRFLITMTDKHKNPLERIKETFRVGIEIAKEKGLNYGCFIGNLTQEMGNISEEISKLAKEIDERKVKLVYDNLVEAFKNKTFKNTLDLQILSTSIITAWQGAQVRMKMNKNSKALDDFYILLCEILLK